MPNESQNGRALEAVNREKGINFPRIIQNTVGALVVASILGLARCAIDIGERFDALTHSYSIHVNDGLRKHALIERDLEFAAKAMEDIHALQIDYARLQQTLHFPFTEEWQQRIRQCEKTSFTCCGKGN